MSVIAVVTDLLFATKIRSTAEALQVPVRFVRSMQDLLDAAPAAGVVLIDLNVSGLDPIDSVRQLAAIPQHPKILTFLSHVQHDLAQSAREAGADEVMPRSRFAAELPEILESARQR